MAKLLLESGAFVDDYDHLTVTAESVSSGNNNNSCRCFTVTATGSSQKPKTLILLCVPTAQLGLDQLSAVQEEKEPESSWTSRL